MQGTRLPNNPPFQTQTLPGSYWYSDAHEAWLCTPPKGYGGHLGGHDVIEHEDGTITVSPSILTSEWHGYLEHGIWQEV